MLMYQERVDGNERVSQDNSFNTSPLLYNSHGAAAPLTSLLAPLDTADYCIIRGVFGLCAGNARPLLITPSNRYVFRNKLENAIDRMDA